MKKYILWFFWTVLLSLEVAAGGIPYDELEGAYSGEWTPLQLSLVPGKALFSSMTPVYGVALGYSISIQGQVAGLHVAPATMTRQALGLTFSLFCNFYDENCGVAVSLVNLALRDGAGFQFGLWNQNLSPHAGGVQFGLINASRCGWQFGLTNVNSHPDALLPWSLVFNYSPEAATD